MLSEGALSFEDANSNWNFNYKGRTLATLSKESQWKEWSFKAKAYLGRKNLWTVIAEEPPASTTVTIPEEEVNAERDRRTAELEYEAKLKEI